MMEPVGGRLRPTTMVRTLSTLLVAVFLLAGCGSAEPSSSQGDTPSEPSSKASSAPPSPTGSPTGSPSVPSDEPPVDSSFSIEVPGLPDPLLVTRQSHPRGGFQLRVFAPDGPAWTELEAEGRPLVPFVATDVQESPVSAECGTGAVVVTEAVVDESGGVAPAYDIVQTSYAVDGSAVTAGPGKKLADNVSSDELAARYPGLVKRAMFEGCRAAG